MLNNESYLINSFFLSFFAFFFFEILGEIMCTYLLNNKKIVRYNYISYYWLIFLKIQDLLGIPLVRHIIEEDGRRWGVS